MITSMENKNLIVDEIHKANLMKMSPKKTKSNKEKFEVKKVKNQTFKIVLSGR